MWNEHASISVSSLFRAFLRLSLDDRIDRVSAIQMQQPPGTSEIHDNLSLCTSNSNPLKTRIIEGQRFSVPESSVSLTDDVSL